MNIGWDNRNSGDLSEIDNICFLEGDRFIYIVYWNNFAFKNWHCFLPVLSIVAGVDHKWFYIFFRKQNDGTQNQKTPSYLLLSWIRLAADLKLVQFSRFSFLFLKENNLLYRSGCCDRWQGLSCSSKQNAGSVRKALLCSPRIEVFPGLSANWSFSNFQILRCLIQPID